MTVDVTGGATAGATSGVTGGAANRFEAGASPGRDARPDPTPHTAPDPALGAWRPSRRRLGEAARAALAPVLACLAVLGGLVVWTGSGAAGSPARIEVTSGRMLPPYGNSRDTVVYFRIANSGGTDDQLTKVTSRRADAAMFARNTRTDGNAGIMRHVAAVTVPADGVLAMSPQGVDVMVTVRGTVRLGDEVPFVLHFRDSGRVAASAVVVAAGRG